MRAKMAAWRGQVLGLIRTMHAKKGCIKSKQLDLTSSGILV